MRGVSGALALGVAMLVSSPAAAGELVFANGAQLSGELSNETLMLSTGSGLVEIAPDEIVLLSRDEVRLRDGRVIHGTLVGGQIKARTTLGEIAIRVDELTAYRGAPAAPAATHAATPSEPVKATVRAPAGGPGTAQGSGVASGLPTMASYQDAGTQQARPASTTAAATVSGVKPAMLTEGSASSAPPRLEVVGDVGVYRDALSGSAQIASVARGQHVTYLDSIDRRLRILNRLVFDGGYWVKVRLADGLEGWISGESVRELR